MAQIFTLATPLRVSPSGEPYPNSLLYFYAAGTLTDQDVFQDAACTIAHAQPVVADSSGSWPVIFLNPNASADYRYILKTSAGVLIDDIDDVPRAILNKSQVGQILYDRTLAEVTASVTPLDYSFPPYDFRRYGALDDGTTDNTANIVATLTSFTAFAGLFYLAPNVKCTMNTVRAAIPLRVVIKVEALINAWDTAGFRQKVSGDYDGGDPTAVNDYERVIVGSGHNASCSLDNIGTAASASGLARVASFYWRSGNFSKQAGQEGLRGLARWGWEKLQSTTKWFFAHRRIVPWEARDYENWYAGKSWTTGDYVLSSVGVYKATTSGTSGSTEPTHTTGTASDGGVTWQVVVPNYDSTIFCFDQYGQIATNTAPVDAVVAYLKADKNSPGGGQANLYVEADGVSQTVTMRGRPTNSSGVVVPMPDFVFQEGVGTRVMKSDHTTEYLRFSDTSGMQCTDTLSLAQSATAPATATGGTITTAALGTSRVSPAGAITGVILQAGTIPGQTITVINESSNTITFAAVGTSNVADGTTSAIPANAARSFVWNSILARWYRDA